MSAAEPFRVLYVEDDAALAASMRALLRGQGYDAMTAGDGPEALAQLAHGGPPPDVLIVDFYLPGGMDGADVAQEICRTVGHVVPTILLSGEISNAAVPWLPGAPLLFAAKPLDAQILLETVAAFAALGRLIHAKAHH